MAIRPTRRSFLGAAAATAGAGLVPRAQAAPPPLIVDVHCHNFNASDLPITGFIAHYIPGVSDLARELWDAPDRLVRALVGKYHSYANARAPGGGDELNAIRAWPATQKATPVKNDAAWATAARTASEAVSWAAALLKQKVDAGPLLDRIAQLINLLNHSRADVTATLAQAYPEVGLFTPLLVDFDAWSDDRPATPLHAQIDVQAEIARLSMAGRIRGAARVHPFVAYDPAREANMRINHRDPYRPWGGGCVFSGREPYTCTSAAPTSVDQSSSAMDIVRYAVERAGFIGVKVYPPLGFAPLRNDCLTTDARRGADLDLALRALYAYCEAMDVPITTHCGPGNEYGLGFRDRVSPARWEPVLREYPRLHLNLGHFGGDEGVDALRGLRACEAWLRQAMVLVKTYDDVYGDLSGSSLQEAAPAGDYVRLMQEALRQVPALGGRIMYGSDWWLNRVFSSNAGRASTLFASRLVDLSDQAGWRAGVMGANALRFLGLQRGPDGRESKNAKRLKAFYQSANAELPSWLA